MMGQFKAAYVIARRDFVATVWSKTFLLFLIAPLFVIGISILSGNMGMAMAEQDNRDNVAVISTTADFAPIDAAYKRLESAFGEGNLPDLLRVDPDYDVDAQVHDLLQAREKKILAVLSGGIERPKLTGAVSETGSIRRELTLIVEEARQQGALARAGASVPPVELEFVKVEESAGSLAALQALTARMGQLILFMLTVFLAGMVLSQLIEEKSNKVIEVLTAAVPVDAVFLGKLFAMLAVSLVGIAVWAAAGIVGYSLWSTGEFELAVPAVGWPLFILLGFVYFAANYLLLGALFLGMGSQASSVREVQTLSMPVTIGQVLLFFLASLAIGAPGSLLAWAAAIFPFSSPLAMIARAATAPEIWPHLAAIAWQALWVWLTLMLSAGLFRRNVMKSGSGGGAPRKPMLGKRREA